ncbi:MAG: hypothetical protein M3Z25_06785 [Actinomycetota bacterium]|nr:hypothetical protein [Actinomycetota bacterium]
MSPGGDQDVADRYPVPTLYAHGRAGRWYVHLYRRQPGVGAGRGLLLDLITTAENTGQHDELDIAAADILGHYRRVIAITARRRTPGELVQKLFGDRAAPGGRLDAYYHRTGRPWLTSPDGVQLAIGELAYTTLLFNGVAHRLDRPAVLDEVQSGFAGRQAMWSAVTQATGPRSTSAGLRRTARSGSAPTPPATTRWPGSSPSP